jgi:hypothetical protein
MIESKQRDNLGVTIAKSRIAYATLPSLFFVGSRFVYPNFVAGVDGQAARAFTEHLAEPAIILPLLAGLWCIATEVKDFKWALASQAAFAIIFALLFTSFQGISELKQAAEFHRALQIDQLAASAIGLGIGTITTGLLHIADRHFLKSYSDLGEKKL